MVVFSCLRNRFPLDIINIIVDYHVKYEHDVRVLNELDYKFTLIKNCHNNQNHIRFGLSYMFDDFPIHLFNDVIVNKMLKVYCEKNFVRIMLHENLNIRYINGVLWRSYVKSYDDYLYLKRLNKKYINFVKYYICECGEKKNVKDRYKHIKSKSHLEYVFTNYDEIKSVYNNINVKFFCFCGKSFNERNKKVHLSSVHHKLVKELFFSYFALDSVSELLCDEFISKIEYIE